MTNLINMREVFADCDARKAAAEATIAKYTPEQVAEASRIAQCYDRCDKTSIKHLTAVARILTEQA